MDIAKHLTLKKEQIYIFKNYVEEYLCGRDKSEIEDIEKDLYVDNIPIACLYVEFYIQLESIQLKSLEIQELKYGNILRRDSAVLSWIVEDEILTDWNQEYKENIKSWQLFYQN